MLPRSGASTSSACARASHRRFGGGCTRRLAQAADVTGGSYAYVVGARPNFVKMAPVVAAMRSEAPSARHIVIHTGQHYDREMYEIFCEELGLGMPDYELGVGSGTHGAQTARALERLEKVLLQERPGAVVVAGDVNSTLAGALAAAKLDIPIAHVESGLRSFDRTMPEELNRLLVDQVSRWCLTHSPEADENLRREGVGQDRIFPVGNTMIDSLVRMRPQIAASGVLERLAIDPKSYLLVTLHRPALVDGKLFSAALEQLAMLAEEMTVIYPVHPRSFARLPDRAWPPGLRLLEPLGYIDFLALETHARGVVTDSGGIQEETTFLSVPCFTLRDSTERPVTVSRGTNTILGLDPAALARIPSLLDAPARTSRQPEGWDGDASTRAAHVLLSGLG